MYVMFITTLPFLIWLLIKIKVTNIAKDQWLLHDWVLLFTGEKRETDKFALIVLNDTVLSVRVVPTHNQI